MVSQQRDKAGRFDYHIRVRRGRDIFKKRDLVGSDCVWGDWANVFSQKIVLVSVKIGLCPVGVNRVLGGDIFVPVNSCKFCQTPSLSLWPGTFKVNSVLLVCQAEAAGSSQQNPGDSSTVLSEPSNCELWVEETCFCVNHPAFWCHNRK